MSESSNAGEAHLKFTVTLHQALAKPGVNACFSPFSIASALGVLSQAARGETAEELAELLVGSLAGLPAQVELLRTAATLTADSRQVAPRLELANTLWISPRLTIEDGFRTELAQWPAGKVATTPFAENAELARHEINNAVAVATRGLIPELLNPGLITADTLACLVNTLYLQAAWSDPFQRENTVIADFHAASGTRRVPTMRRTGEFHYSSVGGWQLITLPLVGELGASVLFPAESLDQQESTMDSILLAELFSAHKIATIDLALPRFTLDSSTELGSALSTLGVRKVFGPAADLSGLTTRSKVHVSTAVHQAVLCVDEAGLEGAAATAFGMRMVAASVETPTVVRVDRPFLFLVHHVRMGAVYFFARIVEP